MTENAECRSAHMHANVVRPCESDKEVCFSVLKTGCPRHAVALQDGREHRQEPLAPCHQDRPRRHQVHAAVNLMCGYAAVNLMWGYAAVNLMRGLAWGSNVGHVAVGAPGETLGYRQQLTW